VFKKILIVCIGNICRSPFAEALLKKNLATSEFDIRSAGLHALVGHPADEQMLAIGDRLSLNMHEHQAQNLKDAHVRWADVILVMEKTQRQVLLERFPMARGKVFLIHEQRAVPDPYRKTQEHFDEAAQLLIEACANWTDMLQQQP